ncbi:uncharacterized protein [Panulirus ornatus]|uniref:uncharacterized protein n=1 Tax=Panulirus ornatus TaxID=150431 RepID=UPI003A8652B2
MVDNLQETSQSTMPLTLPRILHTTHSRECLSGRRTSSGGATIGRDQLSRISELLNHEEAAHEAAHTLGLHDTLEPLPDFVLQEADAVLKTHDDLHNFWRKYHHVQLERLALRSEGEALRKEGRHLRALLRQYFVSLGMTDAALAQSSAPVTVSHLTINLHHQQPRDPCDDGIRGLLVDSSMHGPEAFWWPLRYMNHRASGGLLGYDLETFWWPLRHMNQRLSRGLWGA